jgi:hypothetical protein
VKSKFRLDSYGERTRGRQRSLNVPSNFSWKHVLWRDRGKHICIHHVIERQLPSKVAHYLSICGKNNDCDINDAQVDGACVTSSLFGALNAQIALRDKIQTHSSMFSKVNVWLLQNGRLGK